MQAREVELTSAQAVAICSACGTFLLHSGVMKGMGDVARDKLGDTMHRILVYMETHRLPPSAHNEGATIGLIEAIEQLSIALEQGAFGDETPPS